MADVGCEKEAAIVLAGGDGSRLSSLTRRVFGYDLPKQFFRVFDEGTLLDQTLRRAALVVPAARTITVLNRAHERFYCSLADRTQARNLLIQPANRGTAPAILTALMRLVHAGHTGPLVIFPSDHYVSDDAGFMRHVALALAAVEMSPELVVLLGVAPEGPESDYGWIESCPAAGKNCCELIAPIRRFWEKPSSDVALNLFNRGCLWNSFTLVARVNALESLVARALPDLHASCSEIRRWLGTAEEPAALEELYSTISAADFSASVLARFASELSVLRITGVSWTDLGNPERLLAVVSKGARPQWLELMESSPYCGEEA